MKTKQKEELKPMNVENIPTYLKAHASWCNFRYEERKGNMTKVPYNPATGYKAYVNKPETFTDFDIAVLALKDYDGLLAPLIKSEM